MRPYLEELNSDIREAESKAKETKTREHDQKDQRDHKDHKDHKEQKDQKEDGCSSRVDQMFLSREDLFSRPRRLEEIVGIPQAAFPPEHLLSVREKATLASSMEDLLNSWGFFPDFPEQVPRHMRYKHLRSIWKNEQVFTGMGVNYIDVCDFKESTCPFPHHCNMCDKIREQEKLYHQLMKKHNNNRTSG